MAEVRACAYFLILLVSIQTVTGKPFFGEMWCELFCEDDDPTTTATSTEDYDIFCDGCGTPRRPPSPAAATPTQPTPLGRPGDMSIMIPPSNGMNLTMALNNGLWVMNMVPWPAVATAPAGASPAPAGAAPAPAGAAPAPAGAAPAPAGAAPTPAAATPAPAAAAPAPAAAAPAATTAAPAAAGK